MTHTFRTTSVLGLSAAACLLVLTACGGSDGDSSGSAASDESSAQTSGADVDGIPEVVAEVNGEEVTRDEFVLIYEAQLQQATAQAEAGGGEAPDEDALKEQTANNLVDTALLTQEAESRGIEVTDEDVDAELDQPRRVQPARLGQEFLDALEEQGTTEDQVRSQVELQVMVEQLVADEAGPSEPTEKELPHALRAGQAAAGAGEWAGAAGSRRSPRSATSWSSRPRPSRSATVAQDAGRGAPQGRGHHDQPLRTRPPTQPCSRSTTTRSGAH